MTVKKITKKRVTITFQPDDDVLKMLKDLKIPNRERSKIINQALKERASEVAKRNEKLNRAFREGSADKGEDTH